MFKKYGHWKKNTCIVSGSLRGYRWGLVIDPNAWRCSFSRDWEVWTHLRAWAGSLYWSNVNWVAVGKVDRTCGGKRAGWPPDTNWFLYARTTCKHGGTVNHRGFGGCWWGRKRTMAKIQARSSTAKQINQIQDKAYVVQKQVQQQHFQKLKVRSIAASACVSFSLTTHCVLGSAVLFICIWGISKPSQSVCVNGFENLTHLFT